MTNSNDRFSKGGQRGMSRLSRSIHLSGLALVLIYLLLILTPLSLAYFQDLPPRHWRDELSSALAMTAYAGLLIEFVLSGRFRFVSGRVGIDVTMRFHQLLARLLVGLIILHPFLYVTGVEAYRLPSDVTLQRTLGLTYGSFLTGLVAWIALIVMVILAIWREQRDGSYELWRLLHGMAAILVAVLGYHHTVSAGRYSGDEWLGWFWLALLTLALFTLFWVYIAKPLCQMRHPYAVRSVKPIALRTWELEITPTRDGQLGFAPGQFVWLNVGNSPFSLRENPFSIASAPCASGRLSFVIKEVGDFTRSLGSIEVGTPAYVDGPHGNMTINSQAAAGIALFAGGVGVAPMMSILRHLAATRDNRPVRLLYANRSKDQIVYRAELEEMARTIDLDVDYFLGEPPPAWEGSVGLIDDASIREKFSSPDRRDWLYLICGPLPMIEAIEQALLGIGIPARRIISERFYYD